MWRGGLGSGLSVPGPFVCRCLISHAMLRFHIPLIELDRRISRIQLSDKTSCLRPRKARCQLRQLYQSQSLVEVGGRVAFEPCTADLMLYAEPPA